MTPDKQAIREAIRLLGCLTDMEFGSTEEYNALQTALVLLKAVESRELVEPMSEEEIKSAIFRFAHEEQIIGHCTELQSVSTINKLSSALSGKLPKPQIPDPIYITHHKGRIRKYKPSELNPQQPQIQTQEKGQEIKYLKMEGIIEGVLKREGKTLTDAGEKIVDTPASVLASLIACELIDKMALSEKTQKEGR